MPRQTLGTAPLRNRNRITNKTRLKVIHGNIDADPLVLDEDEEKARIISTAGVDAEDANEHHLQAVLSAASQRTNGHAVRSTRASENVNNKPQAPAAFIPVPDATGVVDNYAELYPSGRWTDPATYLRFSATTEETCNAALASDATYVMDERDEEWLAKNNQEARGEGTSAHAAAMSTSSGTTTRSGASQRSAKSRGKDPEIPQPVAMTEDEFELVMGIFEKVTHDKTEFLHHGFEQGTTFPPFSDYQDTFSSPLLGSMFASFVVPSWMPPSTHLLRIARVVYPHWRDRRIERGGRRIIPYLNFDEADVNNESYICFRRREIKAVRKTRASQVTSSDKLLRLQSELLSSWELASNVLTRETQKKDIAMDAQNVWEKRLTLVDLKRKFPSIMSKEDEELLYDKRPKINDNSMGRSALRLSSRDRNLLGSPAAHQEVLVRPKERTALIQSQIEHELLRVKERDHHWEDQAENPYQTLPVPFSSRLFKYFPASLGISESTDPVEGTGRDARAFRLRFGRGGRTYLDRRFRFSNGSSYSPFGAHRRSSNRNTSDVEDSDDEERTWRLRDRWRYDEDDGPATGPRGPDEEDRVLVDDYQTKYLLHTMTLFGEQDHQNLVPDVKFTVQGADGRSSYVLPFQLGPQTVMRRDFQGLQRMQAAASMQGSPAHLAPSSSNGVPSMNGTPISVQAQMKKMQNPAGSSQIRIPSNAAMRPPAPPSATVNGSGSGVHSSPPQPQVQIGNGVALSIESPSKGSAHAVSASYPHPSAVAQSHASPLSLPVDSAAPGRVSSPMRPKSQNQHHVPYPTVAIAGGFPGAGMNGPYGGYPSALPNGSPYMTHPNVQPNGLSVQQMQSIKSAFATLPGQGIPLQSANVGTGPARSPSMYPTHVIPNGANMANLNLQLGPTNMNLKLPPSRPQWNAAQRIGAIHNADAAGMNGTSVSPSLAHAVPAGAMARAPSANGHHLSPPGHGTASPVNHLMGPAQGRASPSNHHLTPATHSLSLSPHQSSPTLSPSHPITHPTPPRMSQTPVPSPSHQHQLVTGSGAGY